MTPHALRRALFVCLLILARAASARAQCQVHVTVECPPAPPTALFAVESTHPGDRVTIVLSDHDRTLTLTAPDAVQLPQGEVHYFIGSNRAEMRVTTLGPEGRTVYIRRSRWHPRVAGSIVMPFGAGMALFGVMFALLSCNSDGGWLHPYNEGNCSASNTLTVLGVIGFLAGIAILATDSPTRVYEGSPPTRPSVLSRLRFHAGPTRAGASIGLSVLF